MTSQPMIEALFVKPTNIAVSVRRSREVRTCLRTRADAFRPKAHMRVGNPVRRTHRCKLGAPRLASVLVQVA